MKEEGKKPGKIYLMINIILVILFVALEVLSITYLNNPLETKLLARVIARGCMGLLALYNSIYMFFSENSFLLRKNISQKQRVISGILLGIVGFIMILTAFLGYGTNGDPRLIWWK